MQYSLFSWCETSVRTFIKSWYKNNLSGFFAC